MIEISTLNKLNEQNWPLIIKKLTAYVHYQCMKMHFNTHDGELPKGFTKQDLVYEAISKVYSGDRTWDSIKDADLTKFLMYDVLRSMIWGLVVSEENKLNDTSLANDYHEKDESMYGNQVPLVEVYPEVYSFEDEMHAQELLSSIEKELSEDETSLIVLYEIIKGNQNIDIANELGITMEDVKNAKKRIRRATLKIKNKTGS